ncbi:MAG: cob(I)yrinic acid a,c-diamide adenosyltransferase [Cyanobacteriota bacterium]|nr:cob(I)yrinic acid a,c-diamide adenosyltransferase [Cyanobacteriota bacterium]
MAASLADHRPPPRTGAGLSAVPAAPERVAAERPLRLVARPEGLLQIHTAPYRGSFAAVYSQALRNAGLGSRVLVSQFLKGGVDQGVAGSLQLCGRLRWLRPAIPLCLEGPPPIAGERHEPELAAAEQARAAVREVWDFSREQLLAGSVDLMVLDELGLAVDLGWLEAAEVSDALERRSAHLDVILTGPAMPAALMAMADQVTELRRGL